MIINNELAKREKIQEGKYNSRSIVLFVSSAAWIKTVFTKIELPELSFIREPLFYLRTKSHLFANLIFRAQKRFGQSALISKQKSVKKMVLW